MTETIRILVKQRGTDASAEREAFSRAFLLAFKALQDRPGVRTLAFFAPVLGNFQGRIFEEIFGGQILKKLLRSESVQFQDLKLRLATPRTIKKTRDFEAVIAVYVGEKELKILDDVHGLRVVAVVPWTPEAGDYWKSKWQPRVSALPTEK